jgi:hypothetical protein
MDEKQQQQFEMYLGECKRLQKWYVARSIDAARNRIERPRLAFRTSGVIIIICSVMIPFVTALHVQGSILKDVLLSFLGLTIAGLTSVTTFFGWQNQWRRLQERAVSLVHESSLWELKIADAVTTEDFVAAKKIVRDATEQVLNRAGEQVKATENAILCDLQTPKG